MMRLENLQEYFLKGRLLEAMAARKRLDRVLEDWSLTSYGEFAELLSIAASLPEEHAV